MSDNDVRYPDVHVQLSDEDGNAFFIIGRVRRALRSAGCSDDEIEAYTNEASSGDYDNVLQTTMLMAVLVMTEAKVAIAGAFVAGCVLGFEAGLVYVGSWGMALSLAGMYLLGLFSAGLGRAAADGDAWLNGDAD